MSDIESVEMVKKEISFDSEIVKAQKAAVKKKWNDFKSIINKKELLDEPFDLFGNTPIHAVARSGEEKVLRELLRLLSKDEQLEALRWQNNQKNTLLHEIVMLEEPKKLVDTIMNDFEKGNYDKKPLLDIVNDANETPAFRAAKYGKLGVLKHLLAHHQLQSKHFPPATLGGKQRPVLHACVLSFHLDVAVWLLRKVDKSFAKQKVKNDEKENANENYTESRTCLKMLSKLPDAFKSVATQKMGFTERLIYELLPDKGYEAELFEDYDGQNSVKGSRDVESSQPNDEVPGILSRFNYGFWKFAKGLHYIEKIWEQKKRHMFANQLVELLLDNEESWKKCPYVSPNEPIQFSQDYPSNVTKKKGDIELKERVRKEKEERKKELDSNEAKKERTEKGEDDQTNAMSETPIFMAAASGIKEVVEQIVDKYPEALSYVNEDGLNILHVAVKHRKFEIFEYIKNSSAFESLIPRISKDKRTILHQAASMEYYREEALAGVAYQLQHELEWYHQVKEIVPPQYLLHVDKDGLTAGDLLDIDHAEMHDQAKLWMKETAQSCSTVAVLIAGVVFAAAYAIPGGTEKGKPVMHTSSAFRIFTIMDVVALATSLGSVVMFLSILTSSFDLWDFHKSLPRKLKMGFIMLFFSLITTMLAFAATILLTIRMEGNKKSTTLAYSLAFVIVAIFGLTQFPLNKLIGDEVKRYLKTWDKVKMRCAIK